MQVKFRNENNAFNEFIFDTDDETEPVVALNHDFGYDEDDDALE